MSALREAFGLVIATILSLSACATELRIGQTNASAGTVATVPVTCDSAAGAVAAQFDLSFDPSLVSLSGISGGSALAGHVLDHQQIAAGHWRGLVYSPTNAPLGSGVVAWLSFSIPPNTPDGVVTLALANAIASQPAGRRVQPLAEASGALTIVSPREELALAPAGSGQLCATVTGVPGRMFTLQGTPDLFHWANLGSYTNEGGALRITNGQPAGRDAYFYRTVFRPETGLAAAPSSLSSPGLLADGRMRFELNSASSSAWRIQGSPDLIHWGNYGIVTNQSGPLAITNAPFTKSGAYFYRAAKP